VDGSAAMQILFVPPVLKAHATQAIGLFALRKS